MTTQIQLRNGNKQDWLASNPILDIGEIGCEIDNRKIKVGDGRTAWGDLNYFAPYPDFIAFFVK
jgi:hypothetical protein